MLKYLLVFSFIISSLAFAQLRPTGTRIGVETRLNTMREFLAASEAAADAFQANSKRCGTREIKVNDVFELAKELQLIPIHDLIKMNEKLDNECLWSEQSSPLMNCLMDETLTTRLKVLVETKDFKAMAQGIYLEKNPKASKKQAAEETEALDKFLRAVNPLTSIPAKTN